jgi:hypothetical protein
MAGNPANGSAARFGSCCPTLADAMATSDFEPLVTIGDDDVLYVSVGLVNTEDAQPGLVEFPMLYCPFCGAAVQSAADVERKTGHPTVAPASGRNF